MLLLCSRILTLPLAVLVAVMAGVVQAIPCVLPLSGAVAAALETVPVLLVRGRGASSWFDSRFPVIPREVLLGRRLESGQAVRLVSADLPQAIGACGTVERVSGWLGRMVYVDIHMIFCAAPEFDRTLVVLAEPYHLSPSLVTQYEDLRRGCGMSFELHPGWGTWELCCFIVFILTTLAH